jgi:hypothetical protein
MWRTTDGKNGLPRQNGPKRLISRDLGHRVHIATGTSQRKERTKINQGATGSKVRPRKEIRMPNLAIVLTTYGNLSTMVVIPLRAVAGEGRH